MSQSRFFWYYVLPSGVAGGIGAALKLPVPVLAFFVLALGTGQIWNIRAQLLSMLHRWLAIPVLSFAVLCIGGCFAMIGYAFVLNILMGGLGNGVD